MKTISPEMCDTRQRHTCIMCGSPDLSWRATTCGPNCRKRASRRKEAIKREVQAVQDALNNLARLIDRWPDLKTDVMNAMNECVTAATVTYFGHE